MEAKCGVLSRHCSRGAEAVCGAIGRIIQAVECDAVAGLIAQ